MCIGSNLGWCIRGQGFFIILFDISSLGNYPMLKQILFFDKLFFAQCFQPYYAVFSFNLG